MLAPATVLSKLILISLPLSSIKSPDELLICEVCSKFLCGLKEWTAYTVPPLFVHISVSGCCLVSISRHPWKVKDPPPPPLLFSTIGDPCACHKTECVCGGEGGGDVVERHGVVVVAVEMSSVLRLQFHRLAKYPCIHQPRLSMWPWHHKVVKKPLLWQITPAAPPCPLSAYDSRSIPSVKVQDSADAAHLSTSPW